MTASWFQSLTDFGLRPYVATARHQLPALDVPAAGTEPYIACLEDKAAKPFHRAYNIANALAFGARDLTMPGWVYIDCVLMQTAVIGFAAPKTMLPAKLLKEFGPAAAVLDWLPVSGQTASPAIDGKTLVGFSLFSLRSYWPELPALGLATKGLALEVYKARDYERFLGITQYDNPALAMHGRFGTAVEVVAARVPLHAQGDVSLVYGMSVDFDPARLDEVPVTDKEPDFWIDPSSGDGIDRVEEGLAAGRRYFILPPFQVREGQSVKLPIAEEPDA
jgi:hypothetical protein